ncbi:cytochrome P450 2K1-like [Gastrophryne carolinensis]
MPQDRMDGLVEMMPITDPVLVALSIILCILLIIAFYGWKKNPPGFPPGPRPLPIIGNLHMINSQKPYETLHELSKKYGTVYSIHMGEKRMVVLCGYETVKDALLNHAEEFSARAMIPLFNEVAEGHGILFSNGENWKAMRRFTLSTLRDFGMGKKTIEDKIQEETEPFDNTLIINTAVANIIICILLSHRFDYEDPTIQRLVNLINEAVQIFGSPTAMLYNAFPSVLRWLPGLHKKALQNADEVKAFVRETFTAQRNELDINDQRNLIDAFLVKQEEKHEHFTNENLTELVVDLFSAGMETTTTTLRWGIVLMIKYPEIQRKVQNEIEKVIGSSVPQAKHRKEMPYTDAVIHEIQRFGNIVPTNIAHCTTQDVRFRGYYIPKGTMIVPLLTSVLYDETQFEKAKEFYPENFLNANGSFVKKEAFMAFSAGERSCAGENLAKMELFLFFVSLLQNFTFKAPPGSKASLEAAVGFTRGPVCQKICAVSRG